jgi:transcription antitermination protein NusB
MASNRHLSRIVAFQTLYEWEFLMRNCSEYLADGADIHKGIEPILDRNFNEYAKSIDSRDFVDNIVLGIEENQDKIDAILTPAAPEWPIDQISLVDLVILRLGIYELLFTAEVPPKVAINEAVELAKAFGGENSSRFVNGVLGTVFRASDKYDPLEDKRLIDSKKNKTNKTKETS